MIQRSVPVLLCCLVACGALRENAIDGDDDAPVDQPDANEPEEETPDASEREDAGPDAAPPPIRPDVVCSGKNAWFETERSAECTSRKLRILTEGPPDTIPRGNLDLAWSLSGRAGIVLTWMDGPESGILQALTFDTAQEGFIVRQDFVTPPGDFDIEGDGARIVPRADGSFEVLAMRSEGDFGGDVFLRTLPNQQPFTEPILVFSGAERFAQLGLLLQNDGSLIATAMMPAGTDSAIATKRRQPQNTEFDPSFGGPLTLFQPGPLSNGNHRLVLDTLGGVYIVYESGFSAGRSQPRYAQLVTNAWDFRRTVDNNVPDSMSGKDVSLTLIGDEKNVVYLAQDQDEDGGALSSGTLWRARWRGINDEIVKTPLMTGFYAQSGYIVGSAAAASDASGALHVAVGRPVSAPDDEPLCQVLYLHEASTQDGSLEMLEDAVSPVMPCNIGLKVALAVEPGGRPHIAYTSSEGVVYATRYDR